MNMIIVPEIPISVGLRTSSATKAARETLIGSALGGRSVHGGGRMPQSLPHHDLWWRKHLDARGAVAQLGDDLVTTDHDFQGPIGSLHCVGG